MVNPRSGKLILSFSGSIVRLSLNAISVNDIYAAKIVYSTRETFQKSSFYRIATASPVENLFNTANVAYNRRLRRLLGGPISETTLKSFEPTIKTHVDRAMQRISEEMQSRGSADVLKWWTLFATDVIGEVTFGESIKMLEQGKVRVHLQSLGL